MFDYAYALGQYQVTCYNSRIFQVMYLYYFYFSRAFPNGYIVLSGNDTQSIFAHGAWSEPQGILGVVDQMDRVFFIKSNGEEITSTTASQLKLSAPIVGLIVLDDLNAKKSCL